MRLQMDACQTSKDGEPVYLMDKPECKDRINLATWQEALEFNKILSGENACICREIIINRHMIDVRQDTHDLLNAVRPLTETQSCWWGVVVNEAVMNGMRKRRPDGSPFSPEQLRPTELQYGVIIRNALETELQTKFLLNVKDEGEGFDPRLVLNSNHPDQLERVNGRGLWMMIHALCVCKVKNFDARLTYFPMNENTVGEKFRTSNLAIEIPLKGDPDELMQAFLDQPKQTREHSWGVNNHSDAKTAT